VTAAAARTIGRRFLLLRALRWFPTGLQLPVLVLLLTERGFTLAQIGMVAAARGVVVFLLELPTGGLADALGRRPVLVGATLVELVVVALLTTADSMALLAVLFALDGLYRALESGPLDAWYVDATLSADPDADIERGLSRGGLVLGLAVAAGALAAGGIVSLDPLPGVDALAAPLLLAALVRLVEIPTVALLMTETPRGGGTTALWSSVRAVPSVVRRAVGSVRASRVLLALVAVEVFWGFGLTTFEVLIAPRLAQVLERADRAAVLLGPATSAAWLVSAAGAAALPWATRRYGSAVTAAALRLLQGVTVTGMALAAGPAGVIVAFLGTYAIHGASNPVHFALLHRHADSAQRTTVLSANSMVSMPAASLGGIVLGWLADAAGVPVAMIAGALVLAAAAPLYLPAHRAERRQVEVPG
jgi:predicted MFS family arabinose efflux permease